MKASFMQRMFAYIIDFVIVIVVSAIIGMCIPRYNSDELQELNTKLIETENEFQEVIMSGDNDKSNELLQDVIDIQYKISKKSVLSETVSFIVVFIYFVILQFILKGRTFGKIAMGIKVVDKKNKEPSFWVILCRTFIVQGIFTSFISLVTILFLSKNIYVLSNSFLSLLVSIFTIISALMVLYRKDKRGLHDMMAGSIVIKNE